MQHLKPRNKYMRSETRTVHTSLKKVKRNILILTTALMGLISILTAWSGYSGAHWSNETSKLLTIANATRASAIKASTAADHLVAIDINIFTEWLNAFMQGNTQLANYYRAHMRAEAQPAFNAWLAQDPVNNPDAPISPFIMPEYVLQQQVEADRLEALYNEILDQAVEASNTSSQYLLTTVILALALFFAGLATRFGLIKIEWVFVVLAVLALGYGIITLIMLEISNLA
jgi:hypothetical protein